MRILVVRHGLSTANDHNNIGTPAFGSPDASLMPLGIEHAREAGFRLRKTYAVEPSCSDVAVSELQRTYETAVYAGFDPASIGRYALLNEVKPNGPREELREMLDNEILPDNVEFHIDRLFEKPPVQPVWVTSGLIITGLCKRLGILDHFEHFIPKFGEIRDIEIG